MVICIEGQDLNNTAVFSPSSGVRNRQTQTASYFRKGLLPAVNACGSKWKNVTVQGFQFCKMSSLLNITGFNKVKQMVWIVQVCVLCSEKLKFLFKHCKLKTRFLLLTTSEHVL